MAAQFPLSALLSQALVAFTIEFDNEADRQLPHRTSDHGSTSTSPDAVWLASLVMYVNCMQFVDDAGVTISELGRLARTSCNLDGMRRWGYVRIEQDGSDIKRMKYRPDALIRAKRGGLRAREIWRPLFGTIEGRWRERFGENEIARLRETLWAIASRFDPNLPDCLPILGYGLYTLGHQPGDDIFSKNATDQPKLSQSHSDLPLSALLSRVLLGFAIDYERQSKLSIAIGANILRVLDEEGVRVKDIPTLSGVSKESISMATGFLQKFECVVIEPLPPPSRGKSVRLTKKGTAAQANYYRHLNTVEAQWRERFGVDDVDNLYSALEQLVGDHDPTESPLFRGMEPYPDGWRSQVPRPTTLPHFPMVLHRGGYPDGS